MNKKKKDTIFHRLQPTSTMLGLKRTTEQIAAVRIGDPPKGSRWKGTLALLVGVLILIFIIVEGLSRFV